MLRSSQRRNSNPKIARNKYQTGKGIANMGNTCYMNAALQCVAHLPLFRGYFLRNDHLNDLNPENPLGSGGAVARALANVVKELQTRTEGRVEPRAFRRALVEFKRDFAGNEQQDR